MKRAVLVLVALTALAVPASAAAHTNYHNVTITDSPWSNTDLPGQSFQALGCWDVVVLAPGQTKYLYHGGGGGPSHFGFGEWFDTHVHPLNWGDWVTGPETRQFSGQYLTVGTRRVKLQPFPGSSARVNGLKVVYQSGSGAAAAVRANC